MGTALHIIKQIDIRQSWRSIKIDEIQNMMYHCSQLATAIRGEQWLDALEHRTLADLY